MTPDEDVAYVVETLAQELDLLTPGRPTSPAANRALAREFLDDVDPELVEAAIAEARQSDGDLSPWIIERKLLTPLIEHCRSRIRRRTWADYD